MSKSNQVKNVKSVKKVRKPRSASSVILSRKAGPKVYTMPTISARLLHGWAACGGGYRVSRGKRSD